MLAVCRDKVTANRTKNSLLLVMSVMEKLKVVERLVYQQEHFTQHLRVISPPYIIIIIIIIRSSAVMSA